MSSMATTSATNCRRTPSCMRGPAARKPERTIWLWRCRSAKRATGGCGSVACTAQRSILTATKQTSRFARMPASSAVWIISRSGIRIHFETSRRVCLSRQCTQDRTNLRLQTGSGDAFPDDLPPVLKDTIDRLDRLIADAADESDKARATRALAHLYRLLQNQDAVVPGRVL